MMRIIIVGSGRIGAALAFELSLAGHEITVIDMEKRAFERLGPYFKGRTIQGVGFDRDVLLEAGIERADAIAAFTSSDEANAVIVRMAREVFRVPKVVAGLIDNHKADIYKKLGIQVVTTINWAIRRASDILSYDSLHSVYSIAEGRVEIKVVEVPLGMVGRPAGVLNVPGEIMAITLTRRNQSMIPTAETIMEKGDLIHFAVLLNSVEKFKSMMMIR